MKRVFRGRKPAKGGVLVEFALGALLFFTVIFAVLEWSMLLYARSALHQQAEVAARILSNTRDLSRFESALVPTNAILRMCQEPGDLALFAQPGEIRVGDFVPVSSLVQEDLDGAVHFVLRLRCSWNAFLPTGGLLSNLNPEIAVRMGHFP